MLYVRYIYVVFETSTYCLRTAYVLLVVRKKYVLSIIMYIGAFAFETSLKMDC